MTITEWEILFNSMLRKQVLSQMSTLMQRQRKLLIRFAENVGAGHGCPPPLYKPRGPTAFFG
jgi:hypothetical protein